MFIVAWHSSLFPPATANCRPKGETFPPLPLFLPCNCPWLVSGPSGSLPLALSRVNSMSRSSTDLKRTCMVGHQMGVRELKKGLSMLEDGGGHQQSLRPSHEEAARSCQGSRVRAALSGRERRSSESRESSLNRRGAHHYREHSGWPVTRGIRPSPSCPTPPVPGLQGRTTTPVSCGCWRSEPGVPCFCSRRFPDSAISPNGS